MKTEFVTRKHKGVKNQHAKPNDNATKMLLQQIDELTQPMYEQWAKVQDAAHKRTLAIAEQTKADIAAIGLALGLPSLYANFVYNQTQN